MAIRHLFGPLLMQLLWLSTSPAMAEARAHEPEVEQEVDQDVQPEAQRQLDMAFIEFLGGIVETEEEWLDPLAFDDGIADTGELSETVSKDE